MKIDTLHYPNAYPYQQNILYYSTISNIYTQSLVWDIQIAKPVVFP